MAFNIISMRRRLAQPCFSVLQRDNGKENGSYRDYRDYKGYIGIMEKKMETIGDFLYIFHSKDRTPHTRPNFG